MATSYARMKLIGLAGLLMLGTAGIAQRTVPTDLPAVPASEYELVPAGATLLSLPVQRAAALGMLIVASQNYVFGEQGRPDTALSVDVQSTGSVAHEGSGSWTEIWGKNRHDWWSDFDGVTSNRRVDVEKTPIPLRVQMSRMALLWPVAHPSLQEIRAASATFAGKPVTCVLVTEAAVPAPANGRGWRETEYCMDSTGVIRLMSPVPGVYFVYDYAAPLEYAGHTVASDISVIEGNARVMQMHVRRFGTLNEDDQAELAKMTPAPGVLGTPRFLSIHPRGGQAVSAIVIVHAAITPQGLLGETEIIDPSGSGQGQAALAILQSGRFPRTRNEQGEVYARIELGGT